MLINDIDDFSMYTSMNLDYTTLSKRNITTTLATKLTVIGPFAGTILHYAEGDSYN